MDIGSCQKDTIQKIQDYLDGRITDEDASKWALDVIVKTKKLKSLPPNTLRAIQCLADLHDKGESWCPTRDELEQLRTELEEAI